MIHLLLGASFGKGGKWVVGQNIVSGTRVAYDSANSQEDTLKLLELGPKVQYFLTTSRQSYVALTYNLYAKGTRTLAGVSQDVQGTSTIFSFGHQLKLSRMIYVGFSINYHAISITEQKVGTTATDVAQKYTMIYPAFEFSMRFR